MSWKTGALLTTGALDDGLAAFVNTVLNRDVTVLKGSVDTGGSVEAGDASTTSSQTLGQSLQERV